MSSRRKRIVWIAAAALALAAAGASWLVWQPRLEARKASRTRPAIRTVRVRSGTLERTLRLTGATAPERFAALLAPQLRGSRGGGRGGSSSGASSASTTSTATSSSSGSTAVTTTAGGSAAPVSGALATALNRFSTPSSSSAQRSGSGSAAGTTQDLGSTASNLFSTAPGPGTGDWDLILQKVVEPGSRVRKGQVIAEFDRQYQLLRLDDYRANLDQQNEALKALQANLDVDKKAHQQSIETAKANLDKARYDLKTIPVQSAIAAEQLRLAEEQAAVQYRQLLAQVRFKDVSQRAEYRSNVLERDQSNLEFERVRANADKMLIKSPIDGIAVMGSTWRGGEMAQIRAGDELHPGQMFLRVVDPSSMVINAAVNQADIELLRLGQSARIRFDAYPDLELTARVHAIGAMPKAGGFRASFVKEVPVLLKLDGLDPRVIPDLSVSVDVILAAETEATLAPLEAIHFEGAKPRAFVWKSGAFEPRDLELGLANSVAAVVRRGLAPGERVATERPGQEQQP
jgi:HlyD family secretion protein